MRDEQPKTGADGSKQDDATGQKQPRSAGDLETRSDHRQAQFNCRINSARSVAAT